MIDYKNAIEWIGFQPEFAKISEIHFTKVEFNVYGCQPFHVNGVIKIEDQVSMKDIGFNYLNGVAGFNPGEFILKDREKEIINKQIADICYTIAISTGSFQQSKLTIGERIGAWLSQKG